MVPLSELSREDAARVAEYVDGSMGLDERVAFEARMAAEDELAAAVENFEASDELVRAWHAARSPKRSALRLVKGWVAGTVAAAASLIAVVSLMFGGPAARVGFVAGAPTLREYQELHASLRDGRPTVADTSRSGGAVVGEPNADTATFAERAAAILARSFEESIGRARLEAEVFHVWVELEANSTVVIYSVSPSQSPVRLFPNPLDRGARPELGAGLHCLPQEPTTLEGAGVSHHIGYSVPRGQERVRVIVATQDGAPGEDFDGLETFDAAPDEASLRTRLADAGLDAVDFEVVAPKAQ